MNNGDYAVGYYESEAHFEEIRRYEHEADAQRLVNYLNGGSGAPYSGA